MSTYLGDFALESTFDCKFSTVSTTGAPTTVAGGLTVAAYVGNSVTEITAGITTTVDFDTRTGLHNVRVVATAANGYATASNYQLVVTVGTVGGTSIVGYVVGQFSIEARSALRPTVVSRTLDVTATGAAGIDWANVEAPTTTLALTGTTIATTQKVDIETIKTNPVVNAGTITFPTTATLASTTNITAGTLTTVTTATNVTTVNGLAANVITAASMNDDASTEIANKTWDTDATGHQTQGSFGQVLGDSGADADSVWSLANTNLDATVSSRSTITTAQVNTEVDTAIADARLDELLAADSDIDGAAPPTVGSVFHELLTKTVGSFTYDQTTDSLEAVRDRGDAAWITATGFATSGQATTLQTSVDDLPTNAELATALGTADDATLAAIAALSIPSANANADALLDRADAIEAGLTPRQAMRLQAAATAGKLSGAATATNTIRNAVADSKDRIVATVDADGNRTAITYDLTS